MSAWQHNKKIFKAVTFVAAFFQFTDKITIDYIAYLFYSEKLK